MRKAEWLALFIEWNVEGAQMLSAEKKSKVGQSLWAMTMVGIPRVTREENNHHFVEWFWVKAGNITRNNENRYVIKVNFIRMWSSFTDRAIPPLDFHFFPAYTICMHRVFSHHSHVYISVEVWSWRTEVEMSLFACEQCCRWCHRCIRCDVANLVHHVGHFASKHCSPLCARHSNAHAPWAQIHAVEGKTWLWNVLRIKSFRGKHSATSSSNIMCCCRRHSNCSCWRGWGIPCWCIGVMHRPTKKPPGERKTFIESANLSVHSLDFCLG